MAILYPADDTIHFFIVKVEKLARNNNFKHELSVERHHHPSAIADHQDGIV
jgi:hypothetical protein